jgi:hypothetical protein
MAPAPAPLWVGEGEKSSVGMKRRLGEGTISTVTWSWSRVGRGWMEVEEGEGEKARPVARSVTGAQSSRMIMQAVQPGGMLTPICRRVQTVGFEELECSGSGMP